MMGIHYTRTAVNHCCCCWPPRNDNSMLSGSRKFSVGTILYCGSDLIDD